MKKFRVAVGLTQEELGRQIGVQRETVSQWETRKQLPSLNPYQYRALCNALKITPNELLDALAPGGRSTDDQTEG